MSKTIKLTPELLEAQAASMRELSEAQQAYNARIKSTINKMNDGLTTLLRHNISFKTTLLLTQASGAASLLNWAVTAITKVTEEFARTQQNLKDLFDKVLGSFQPDKSDTVTDTTSPEKPIVEDSPEIKFQKKVEEMKQKEGFRQGDYNHSNFMEWVETYNGQYVGGAQCYAMAHMMQIETLGARGYNCGSTAFGDIKAGDVIHYYGGGADAEYGHWVFVTDVRDGRLIVSEGNFSPGAVTHGREIKNGTITIAEIRRV